MTDRTPALIARKPVAAALKPIQLDFKAFFKTLTKGVAHSITFKWAELVPDVGELTASMGLSTEPGELAWRLVVCALLQATGELVADNAELLNRYVPKSVADVTERANCVLELDGLEMNAKFFDRPADQIFYRNFSVLFKQWLLNNGMEPAEADKQGLADNIVARLPTYFVYALNQEWRKHADVYKPLKEALDTPFTKAGEHEQAWIRYYAWLQKQVNEGVFDA